nr:formyltransferase family protein [uncultured Ruminococcus sp.]
MKTAFCGFDLMYPAMEALASRTDMIKLFTCEVDGVYETNHMALSLASKLGIPQTTKRITREDIDELVDTGCELLVSAGYYYKIPVDRRLKMVNIHPSLLPYGRGAWPMPLAILDGLTESGVTIHKTEERFDTGDILLQERFSLNADEDLMSFMGKVNHQLLPTMMDRLINDLDRLWNKARPQGIGEYQTQPDPADYVIRPTDTVEYADRVLRAFFGFPCFYDDGERKYELVSYRAFEGAGDEESLPLADGHIERVFAI